MRAHFVRFALFAVLVVTGALVSSTAVAQPPVSFAPATFYDTPWGPSDVTTGDLNGDGWLDAIVTNHDANWISVLMGAGAGLLQPAVTYPVLNTPVVSVVGDLNGDGKLDVVVSHYFDPYISLFFGRGDGTFEARQDLPAVPNPGFVAIADLDHDGRLDIVATCLASGVVEVFLGNGDGTFAPPVDHPAGTSPITCAVEDFNGDGHPDLGVPVQSSGEVLLLAGHGDGTFAPPVVVGTVPGQVDLIRSADFDGDGAMDFAVRDDQEIAVFMGHGDGTFTPAQPLTFSASPSWFAFGDLNGDGHPDLAVPLISDQLAVRVGGGDGSFGPETLFPTGYRPSTPRIADLDRDGRPDVIHPNWYGGNISVFLNRTEGSTIAALRPTTCLSPTHPCTAVPVDIRRADAQPIRGFSVTVQLSANLALCDVGIVEGSYLRAAGGTLFQVIANGGGSYTVDCGILGLPCGATAPTGTLFTIDLGTAGAAGDGTVAVTAVSLRDCANAPIVTFAGPPAIVTSEGLPPGTVALSASQRKAGNDRRGTTAIDLSWSGSLAAGDTVLVYRAGWGGYPEYDLGAGEPAAPGDPPGSPWTLVRRVVGGTTCVDEPATRDFWYYVAFVKNACGRVGPASNLTRGTLDYHLGDVSRGSASCAGNNRVSTEDISLLGAHYGLTLSDPDPLGCLDVGPTTDGSVNGRPLPDDRVNFEDLMIFIMNYRQVSAPQLAATPVAADRNELTLEAPATVAATGTFDVTLRLKGAGNLQGLSAQLAWNSAIAEPVSVEPGDLLTGQGGLVLSSAPGNVDAALLGPDRGFAGDGVLATVRFRALGTGEPRVTLARVDARDTRNQPTTLVGIAPARPAATAFAAAQPNPFGRATTLRFTLAEAGPVELAIFSVDGRRVRTLASGFRAAGACLLTWDGTDDGGRAVQPGMFYGRLTTPGGRLTRTLVMIH